VPLTTPSTSSLDSALLGELATLRDDHLERSLRTVGFRRGAAVRVAAGDAIDFSSNDYLGLASDARLVTAMSRSLAEQGVGATASRLIAGNNPEHDALDAALAEFFGAEAALSFSSGFAANVGIIPALVGRGDAIFADALNHASLIDGCRLSRAAVHVYPHADALALRSLLAERRAEFRRALIVTDGVFSMDGDRAPLEQIVAVARDHGAWTYVDDAHAVGVVGPDGRGTAADAGLVGDIDVTVGTLGKAFGAAGAFVYGSATLRRYLVNRARSFVFSTGMLPSQAAAAREGLRIARAEPERRERVIANARHLRAALRTAGIATLGDDASHIVPVDVASGDAARTMAVGDALANAGYLVGAVRPPTVPQGTSRLRITVTAAHDEAQMLGLVSAIVRCGVGGVGGAA
jgi:8-amino-7-oxononanoate synthase